MKKWKCPQCGAEWNVEYCVDCQTANTDAFTAFTEQLNGNWEKIDSEFTAFDRRMRKLIFIVYALVFIMGFVLAQMLFG